MRKIKGYSVSDERIEQLRTLINDPLYVKKAVEKIADTSARLFTGIDYKNKRNGVIKSVW